LTSIASVNVTVEITSPAHSGGLRGSFASNSTRWRSAPLADYRARASHRRAAQVCYRNRDQPQTWIDVQCLALDKSTFEWYKHHIIGRIKLLMLLILSGERGSPPLGTIGLWPCSFSPAPVQCHRRVARHQGSIFILPMVSTKRLFDVFSNSYAQESTNSEALSAVSCAPTPVSVQLFVCARESDVRIVPGAPSTREAPDYHRVREAVHCRRLQPVRKLVGARVVLVEPATFAPQGAMLAD
jgi:hypothetical protein